MASKAKGRYTVQRRCVARRSKKQKVWNYMRRNKKFSVAEVMIAVGVDVDFLRHIFWQLKAAQYIRLLQDAGKYEERIYAFINDTGIKSPALENGVVFDHNTNETTVVKKLSTRKSGNNVLVKLLNAMTGDDTTRQAIAEKVGVSVSSGSTTRAFALLNATGVMKENGERLGSLKLYTIDREKRDELLRDLQEDR